MLEKMIEKRVFTTELSESKTLLAFSDGCDEWFYAQLTKTEVIELANDLLAVANNMVDKVKK